MADLSTIALLPIVPGMDPGQIYNVLETLQAGILGFGQSQHRDDGKHAIDTGLTADRAAATWAGMQFMAYDDDILSVSYETAPASGVFQWKEFTLNALSNSFTYGAFSAGTVQEHLEFLLDMAETTKKLKAAETTYASLGSSNVVAASSDAKTAIGALDVWAGTVNTALSTDAADIVTLETWVTSIENALSAVEGSELVGFYNPGAGTYVAIGDAAITVNDALVALNAWVTSKWNPSLGANIEVINNGQFFSTTPLVLDTMATEIGNVLGNHVQEVYTQLYVDGTISSFPHIVARVPCPVTQAEWVHASTPIKSVHVDSLQAQVTSAPASAGLDINLHWNAVVAAFDTVFIGAIGTSAESVGSNAVAASTDYVRVELDLPSGVGTAVNTMIVFRWKIIRDLSVV